MATKVNEILQFASQDTGSNLLTQTEYDGDAQRVIGHQPGIARSRLENKVLRQCSTITAGLAEFMLQNQDGSITDGMTPQEIADAMLSSVSSIAGASGSVSLQKSTVTPTFSPSLNVSYEASSSTFDMFKLSIGGEDRMAFIFGKAILKATQEIVARRFFSVFISSAEISNYNYFTGFGNSQGPDPAYVVPSNKQIHCGVYVSKNIAAGSTAAPIFYGGILVKWQ